MALNVPHKLALFREQCEALRGLDYCTDTVIQALAAVSRHETCLDTCRPFLNTGNHGAMQCPVIADKAGHCPTGCFNADDSSPTATGGSVKYHACFILYPDETSGVRGFLRLMTVQRKGIAASLSTGDAQQIAQAMRDARYYEGEGATQEQRVHGYATAILRNARMNAADAKIDLLIVLPPPPAPPALSASAGPPASAAPSASTTPAPSASAVVLVDPVVPEQASGDEVAARIGAFLFIAGAIGTCIRRVFFTP